MVDKERGKMNSVFLLIGAQKENSNFDIINNISGHVILVQVMDSTSNGNHGVIVIGKWIFNFNYEEYMMLSIEYLNLICYSSEE